MDSYLIESLDSLSLEKEKNNIIENNSFKEAIINNYDLEIVDLNEALEDLDTYSFLSSKKVIIIKNIESIKYDDNKKAFDHLLKYINNPNSDNLLIIEAHKLNNTTKITKELKKVCKYQEIKIDSKDYVKKFFKDYKIDSVTINYLITKCLDDFTKINQECLKLSNYKDKGEVITKEDIDTVVVEKLGDPQDLTFSFTRSLALRDVKDALIKYQELLNYNIEPLSIIGLLGSQFRIIYQVKVLSNDKLNDNTIADKLGVKPYRITKTRELINYYTEEELLDLMQEIANIDLRIKSEDIDPNLLIELLIINSNKNTS